MHLALGEHRIVLQFRLLDGRGIRRDKNELGLTRSQALNRRAIAHRVLSGLDDESEARVHVIAGLLLTLDHFEGALQKPVVCEARAVCCVLVGVGTEQRRRRRRRCTGRYERLGSFFFGKSKIFGAVSIRHPLYYPAQCTRTRCSAGRIDTAPRCSPKHTMSGASTRGCNNAITWAECYLDLERRW